MVRLVRNRLKVLALRHLFLYWTGHACQRTGGAVSGRRHYHALLPFFAASGRSSARTLWWPGIVLYFAMVLPWFIAVQHQNPTFFREFFLEHNLERFATDRYEHQQPFWYYIVVVILAMMPWTVIAVRALVDGVLTSVAEWRLRHAARANTYGQPSRRCLPRVPGALGTHSHRLFLLLEVQAAGLHSAFNPPYRHPHRRFSVSAPPGRTQPLASVGPCDVLRSNDAGGAVASLVHCQRCQDAARSRRGGGRAVRPWAQRLLILIVTKGFGVARLRLVTCAVLAVMLLFLYGVGPFFGIAEVPTTKRVIQLLDRSYSARPLAEKLATIAPENETVAVFRVRRDTEYGLSFYRNREVVNYEQSGVPDEQHLLVARVTGPPRGRPAHPGRP